MAKGTWAATEADSEVLAADASRTAVEFQHTSGTPIYLAFGEAAVFGEGMLLRSVMPYYQVTDSRAALAIHMICDTGLVAGGGYQTT